MGSLITLLLGKRRLYCLLKECACGCGEFLTEGKDRHRNRKQYNIGHQNRLSGVRARRWKGGFT